MECSCCRIKRRRLLCAPCATTVLSTAAQDVATAHRELKQVQARCSTALEHDGRVARASAASLRLRIQQTREAIEEIGQANARQRIDQSQRRADLDRRRHALLRAQEAAGLHGEPGLEDPFDQRASDSSAGDGDLAVVRAEGRELADRLARERHRLVRGTLAAFGVRARRRKGAAPSSTSISTDTKDMRWEIAGLAFPELSSWAAYSSTHLNAALMHTIHLFGLLAQHLDVMLPFDIGWRNQPLVGKPNLAVAAARPFIELSSASVADFNDDDDDNSGHFFPWDDRPDLYVSSSRQRWMRTRRHQQADIADRERAHQKMDLSQSILLERAPAEPPPPPPPRLPTNKGHLPASTITTGDRKADRESALVLAFSMLSYDVMYLARTQRNGQIESARTASGATADWTRPLAVLASLRDVGR